MNRAMNRPDCHREERSDVAIQLKLLPDCRDRWPLIAEADDGYSGWIASSLRSSQ